MTDTDRSMLRYDVFNGDADGICALHQLRLTEPAEAELVTGTKRENALLGRIRPAAGDLVTALDIAMPGNRDALVAMLALGVRVTYVDHHEPGEIPTHPLLDATIDTAPTVCTSILVDRRLAGRHRPWAVVGAFGDNLAAPARALAASLERDDATLARWRELGECLNYNAYGMTEDDLVYRPAALYRALAGHPQPDGFIDGEPHFERLRTARTEDLARARACAPIPVDAVARLHRLPEAAWARRVSGSYANLVFNEDPGRAQVIAVPRGPAAPGEGEVLQLSLRMPLGSPVAAHEICAPFGGGGRRGAAGVDRLPEAMLGRFCEALGEALRRSGAGPA
ncbi:MAG: hypothetical protein RJA99_4312 [Pseudomonadota bacterium]|jgi:hypothetical protein